MVLKNIISLKNSREFGAVYNRRVSFANKYLIMYIAPNQKKEIRLGISVSKKVGNSVIRHRVTRLIRESYRLNQSKIKPGFDIVVVARPMAKEQSYWNMESAFLHLLRLHEIMKEQAENVDGSSL